MAGSALISSAAFYIYHVITIPSRALNAVCISPLNVSLHLLSLSSRCFVVMPTRRLRRGPTTRSVLPQETSTSGSCRSTSWTTPVQAARRRGTNWGLASRRQAWTFSCSSAAWAQSWMTRLFSSIPSNPHRSRKSEHALSIGIVANSTIDRTVV